MKKYVRYGLMNFIAWMLLAACGSSGPGTGTSLVTITIGGQNTLAAGKAGFADKAPVMPAVVKIVITVSGPNMNTKTYEVPYSVGTAISKTIEVPTGDSRTFLVTANDATETLLYKGSAMADLKGLPVTLDIPLYTVFFAGTRLYGTPQADETWGIARDAAGFMYIVGDTYGDMDGNLNSAPTHTTSDAFITKLDPGGVKVWTKLLGTASHDVGYGVAVDSKDNVYITGTTLGDLAGTNTGGVDSFVAKFDSSGKQSWLHQFGTTGNDFSTGIAVDSSGNVYVSGYTDGDLDGNINIGLYDAFVMKYDSAGVKQWTKQFGTTADDYAESVAVDASGKVYLTGDTRGSLGATNTGLLDIFIAKYDSSGNQVWIQQLGSAIGEDDEVAAIAVDAVGNVFIAGGTFGDLNSANAGFYDLFVVKYSSSGAWQWTQQLGSSANDYAEGIAVDPNGNVYVTGYTDGNLDGIQNADATGLTADLFVVKYDSAGTKQWTRQTGTTSDDIGVGIVADSSGNVYVTGDTFGYLDGNTNAGSSDVFLLKYDSNGLLKQNSIQ